MLVEAYSNHALCRTQCFVWFKKFRVGQYEVTNQPRGRPSKKFELEKLQALLTEDPCQTQKMIAEQPREKNARNGTIGTKEKSCYTTTLRLTGQMRQKKSSEDSAGRSYPTRSTLQTLLHRTTTFSHRWDTLCLSSASPIFKKCQIGSKIGSGQKVKNSSAAEFENCLRDGRLVWLRKENISNKICYMRVE